MKNCPPRARLVAAPDCATEANAASAKVRAIACSSTEMRRPFDKKDRGVRVPASTASSNEASVLHSAKDNSYAQIQDTCASPGLAYHRAIQHTVSYTELTA